MPEDWEGHPPARTTRCRSARRRRPTRRSRSARRSSRRISSATARSAPARRAAHVLRRPPDDAASPERRTETMTVNMGPQHPSTHGVLRLVLELEGEVVSRSMPTTIGYLHTGIEKTAEQKKWQQVVPLVERMDYLGAQSNSLAYVLSVEKLLGLEMPQRVQGHPRADRRAAAHGEPPGLARHARAGDRRRLDAVLRDARARAADEHQRAVAGFRFFPSYIRVGGLREDLPRGFHEAVTAFLDRFPGKLDEYEGLLTKNMPGSCARRAWASSRTRRRSAWGLVGPIARASGSDYDVRKYFPYSATRPTTSTCRPTGRRRLRPLPGAHARRCARA
jgi:NADH-quinone oxidoreductase subunit D